MPEYNELDKIDLRSWICQVLIRYSDWVKDGSRSSILSRLSLLLESTLKSLRFETLESRDLLTATLYLDVVQTPAVSFAPREFVVMGDQLIFSANDGLHGRELWRSDGTQSGTRLIQDIAPGIKGSDPEDLFLDASKGLVFFRVGSETWQTDGTTENTRVSTSPANKPLVENWVRFQEADYFLETFEGPTTLAVRTMTGGHEFPLSEVPYGLALDGLLPIEVFHDSIYVVAPGFARDGGGLWKSDGTADGTRRVMAIDLPGSLVQMGDHLYFSAETETHGMQLWRSDGTLEGTMPITDVASGNAGSDPHAFVKFNESLVFATLETHHVPSQPITSSSESLMTPPNLWRHAIDGTELLGGVSWGDESDPMRGMGCMEALSNL